jgi:hypothetical protein
MKIITAIVLLMFSTTGIFGQPNQRPKRELHNGKGIYENKGKFGFINYAGKINYLYDSITSPTTDNYAFAMKNTNWGVIDLENNIIIPFEYEQIQETSNKNEIGKDTFIVQKNGLLGTIDFNNKIVIPVKYDAISGFCETNFNGHYVAKNGKIGIIDENGKIILPTEYDFLYYYSKETIKAKRNGKYGLINSEKKIIIPFEYDALTTYTENQILDKVCIDNFVLTKKDSIYFFDRDGKRIQKVDYISEDLSKNYLRNIDSDFKYINACMITKK